MLTDPLFYLVAIPGVMLYGIAKGGFAGPVAVLAVPLMSLVMSPTLAAAILLPILVVMDGFVVKTYWGLFDKTALRYLLPPAMVGIGLGYLSAEFMNDDYMRLLIGAISLAFGLQSLLQHRVDRKRPHKRWSAGLFGSIAGFTSFSIHAGGPPFTMYLMPRGLSPLLYAGTAGIFFAVVNLVKLFPYYVLDQLLLDNLLLSLVLLPLAPLGVAIGHRLVKRTEPQLYYRIISVCLIVLGTMLILRGLGLPAA
ncbi:MAG: sulfite exporter TauE/SafE family protein [Halieaceae bacterium]